MSDPSSGTAARDQDSGLPARGGDARIDRPTFDHPDDRLIAARVIARHPKAEALIATLLSALAFAAAVVVFAHTQIPLTFTDLPPVGR